MFTEEKPSKLGDIMTALNDPRLPIYSYDFEDFDNHPYFRAARNYPLITYYEQKFMEAEALMMTGGDDAAIHDAFMEGVTSSFDYISATTPFASDSLHMVFDSLSMDYMAAIDPGEGNVTMEDIMTQKYIAMYTEPEVYNDWRRTNIPELTPNSGSTIPYRFPYPSSELTLNLNTPPVDGLDAITDPANKVWWDIN
ncbi:MAG TPA: SusD/RagB family nutrient-binding outer membrane lipoprotein [Phaeodactylibacter sp.]|nr:SusD/RagB family nutrient-binding outer membrane lipoprotein [Phaeodactylibacter sp.]